MELNELRDICHEGARHNGWWDDPDANPPSQQIVNMIGELSEAWEEIRKGKKIYQEYVGEGGKPEGVPSEFADTIIRILDTCGYYGIDIEGVILDKLEYNKTRGHRHGGKTA